MIVKKFVVAAALALATASALAAHCPMDMKQIDAALAEKPQSLHKAGKHQESVETLGKAKAILGI